MLLPFACMLTVFIIHKTDLLNDTRFAIIDCVPKSEAVALSQPYKVDGIIKKSVSHYYYSAAGPLFTGTLISLAIFFFCYRGHQPKARDQWAWLTDNRLANVAAWLALGVVIFPTSAENMIPDNLFIFRTTDLTGGIHLACASLFFVAIAMFCIINFRRNDSGGFENNAINTWFLISGWGMLIILASIGIYISLRTIKILPDIPYVFWAEVIMLVLFGSAWLLKGRVLSNLGIAE